ncbi:CMF_collapsed_G0013490.mRNA.1.CDS.1 [Saccharomyces cerevisiae]|nr:CMF_collapsed_G0013490.mRNA.1.CDS.1 [Saccharomyces cerevisiae]
MIAMTVMEAITIQINQCAIWKRLWAKSQKGCYNAREQCPTLNNKILSHGKDLQSAHYTDEELIATESIFVTIIAQEIPIP